MKRHSSLPTKILARLCISQAQAVMTKFICLFWSLKLCAQGQRSRKAAVLALLVSGRKLTRFEVSNDKASVPALKVFCELPEYQASAVVMAQAMMPDVQPHASLSLGLKNPLHAHCDIIGESPKTENTAYLSSLAQANPSAQSKCPERACLRLHAIICSCRRRQNCLWYAYINRSLRHPACFLFSHLFTFDSNQN